METTKAVTSEHWTLTGKTADHGTLAADTASNGDSYRGDRLRGVYPRWHTVDALNVSVRNTPTRARLVLGEAGRLSATLNYLYKSFSMIWTFPSPNALGQPLPASTMTVSLQSIVDDILIHILRMLSLGDVLSVRQVNPLGWFFFRVALIYFIRQTSKRLETITYLRTIWYDQFCFEVLFKGLPIPGTIIPLPEIPALDLEWRTRLAVQVQKKWTRPAGPLRPVLQRIIPPAQQIALRIGGHELLTLHANKFSTWRLDGAHELSTDNILLEYGLEGSNTWKICKDLGDSDTVAIASR